MKKSIIVLAIVLCKALSGESPLSLNDPKGIERLIDSKYSDDFWLLNSYYQTQKTNNCGAGSAVMVLNALDIHRPSIEEYFNYKLFTQDHFIESIKGVITEEELKAGKLDINILAKSLNVFQMNSSIIDGKAISAEEFRTLLKETLNNPQKFIIANYHRPSLGHEGTGTFSPIGAYDEKSDSVLMLDVLRQQRGSFWVETETLLKAIQTPEDSGQSRGLIMVQKPYLEIFSEEGKKMLKNSQFRQDYFNLSRYFETQDHWTYCAVASGVAVMNALIDQELFSQDNFFTEEIKSIVTAEEVKTDWRGVTAHELVRMFGVYGFSASFTSANTQTADQFRDTLKKVLSDPEQMMIANYLRPDVGQVGGGHFSPVVAYNQESDSVLIMDTSRYKYAPVWIDLGTFLKSMSSKDDAGLSRGYVTVSR